MANGHGIEYFTSDTTRHVLATDSMWLFTIDSKSNDNRWVLATLTSSANAEDGGRVEQVRKLYSVPCEISCSESDMPYTCLNFQEKSGSQYLKVVRDGKEELVPLKNFKGLQ